jgi:hypothetical protein
VQNEPNPSPTFGTPPIAAPAPAAAVEAAVEPGTGAPAEEAGPDRDRVTLEALEAELAVLEAELARVDGSPPPPNP